MRHPLMLLLPLLPACEEIEIKFPGDCEGSDCASDTDAPDPPEETDSPGETADPDEPEPEPERVCVSPEESEVPLTWTWGEEITVELAGASFVGEVEGDFAGICLLAPGDMDGDGVGDLVIGTPNNSELSEEGGKVYFVNGRVSGWSQHETLAGYPAMAGHASNEICSADALGDVNGDGLADIALDPGYSDTSPPDGQYLVLGSVAGWTGTRSTEESDAVAYYRSFDPTSHQSNLSSHSTLGDMDGDGLDDWLLTHSVYSYGEAHLVSGADIADELWVPDDTSMWVYGVEEVLPPYEDPYYYFSTPGDLNGDGLAELFARQDHIYGDYSNRYYLIAGSPDGLPSDQTIAEAAATVLIPPDNQRTFQSYGFLGDIDGDGINDLGVELWDENEGAPENGNYLFLGRSTFRPELTIEDADIIIHTPAVTKAPQPLGDINGDGIADIGMIGPHLVDGLVDGSVVGPPTLDPETNVLYVFFGRTDWPEELNLGDADVRILGGEDVGIQSTPGEGKRGDVNCDGITDLLLGQSSSDYGGVERAGAMALLLGRTDWPEELSLDESDVRFVGSVEGQSLGSLMLLSDLNADGYDDVVLSSARHPEDEASPAKGETFIFFGQSSP